MLSSSATPNECITSKIESSLRTYTRVKEIPGLTA